MSTIWDASSLQTPVLNSALLSRVNGPATARNLAKTVYNDKTGGQTNQPAATYQSSTNWLKNTVSYTPESANEAAAKGTPTHGFFYHNIDTLAQLAADPDQTLDKSFAKDMLDFFTGGNYKSSEVDDLQSQLTTALQEMAQQLADTGRVDANKLESRLTIDGVDMSLGELAEFQTMGRQLSPVFDGIGGDNSRFQDMQAVAKMAVARLMGQNFGKTRGEAGAMFSAAIDQLYQKGMNKIDELYTDGTAEMPASAASESAAALRGKVNDMFSGLNTTNKSALANDFNKKLGMMQAMMTQRDNQFKMPSAGQSAATAARNVGLYFSALYRML